MTIIPDVFPQLSGRHPFRHELKGFEGDTLEGHNIGVIEALPQNGLLAKCLQKLSGGNRPTEDCGDEIPV